MFFRQYQHKRLKNEYSVTASARSLIIEDGLTCSYNFQDTDQKAINKAKQVAAKQAKKRDYEETAKSLSHRELEMRADDKRKFWRIRLDDESCWMNYGTHNKHPFYAASGRTQTKYFDSADEARRFYHAAIDKKLNEGYVELHVRETPYSELPPELAKKPARKKAAKKVAKKSAKQAAGRNVTSTQAAVTDANRVALEYSDAKSSKFWRIELDGKSHTVQYGRIGTNGQSKTKDFSDDAAARASFDKLVAEKRKKGYVDAATTSVTKPKASQQAAKKAEVSPKPDAVVEEAPPRKVVIEVTSRIDLDPRDWFWAMWRDPDPLPEPAHREFDFDACVEQIRSIKGGRSRGRFVVGHPEDVSVLSPAEAEFWMHCHFQQRSYKTPNKLADAMAAMKVTGKVSVADIKRLHKKHEYLSFQYIAQILNADDYIELLLALPYPDGTSQFRDQILPYMSRAQRKKYRKSMGEMAETAKPPKNFHTDFHVSCYLAAALGNHSAVRKVLAVNAPQGHWHSGLELAFGLNTEEMENYVYDHLKEKYHHFPGTLIRPWIAHTELTRLDFVKDRVMNASRGDWSGQVATDLGCVKAPDVAPMMLEFRVTGRAPDVATDWLDTEIGNSVTGLVPVAVGRSKLAEAAQTYLREKQRLGFGSVINKALKLVSRSDAKRLKDTVLNVVPIGPPLTVKTTPKQLQAAIDQAADLQPIKKDADWIVIDKLPPLAVGKGSLSREQVAALLLALQHSDLEQQHELVDVIAKLADREVLAEFIWSLFELWLGARAPRTHRWAMHALGLLGNDDTVLKLTPLIRAWPGESQHPRAVLGLQCLRAIGSEVALMQLSGIAQKVKFKGLQQQAMKCVDQIAAEMGMTKDQLEDRVVPDCGLDKNGSREFDFGPRKFFFSLSPENKPVVRDEDRKIRKDMPKPGANDDADKAKQALADWKQLKSQIRDTVKVQNARLEQALITGRRWSPDDFDKLLVRHPFMTNLVQRLLWGGFNKQGILTSCFRITEERDFADIEDNTTSLDGFESIGMVHPLHLDQKRLSQWGEQFSDYEIVPPFPQLGRPVHRLTAAEKKKSTFQRFENLTVPAYTLLGILNRNGWTRGMPQDNGVFCEHYKHFYDADLTASVAYRHGIGIAYFDGEEDQDLEAILFLKGIYKPTGWPRHKPQVKLGSVDPVIVSEVIADLMELEAKAV